MDDVRRLAWRGLGRTGARTSCTPTSGCPAWPRCRAGRRPGPPGRPDLPRPRRVKRRHQGDRRHEPAGAAARRGARRPRTPTSVIATCTDEVFELARLGRRPRQASHVVPCGVDTSALHAVRAGGPGRGPRDAAAAGGCSCVGRLVERKGVDDAIARAGAAARRTSSSSSRAGRTRPTSCTATPRRGGCARWPASSASPTGSACSGRCPREAAAGAAALGRRGRLRPLVRAVRHRAARGDGLRASRSSACGGRRHASTPSSTGSPACRAAARPRAALAAVLGGLLDDPAPAAALGAAGVRRARRSTTGTGSRRATDDVLPLARARARAPPGGAGPAVHAACRGRTSTSPRSRAPSRRCAQRRARLERWGRDLAGRSCRPARACSPPATAAAPRRPSTSRPSSWGGSSPTAGRSAAICPCAETVGLTAIVNDYGREEVFARQVRAHGRPGDVLAAARTIGHEPATSWPPPKRGHEIGLTIWALTGPGPNPLAERSPTRRSCVPTRRATATVQEVHLVAVHAGVRGGGPRRWQPRGARDAGASPCQAGAS